MDRNYLKGPVGDGINAILAAVGYNLACSCDGSQNSCVPSSGPSLETAHAQKITSINAPAFFTGGLRNPRAVMISSCRDAQLRCQIAEPYVCLPLVDEVFDFEILSRR